ncbi:HAMP domain-containing histidine kinase [bacterium]|nr:HAMP domain-containing histidine kinase [bacterium]
MKTPRFTRTLHFRMSALFLLLLGLSVGGYYWWINATVFRTYQDKEEEIWYEEKAEDELAGLAAELTPLMDDGPLLGRMIGSYAEDVERFGVEVILFDGRGFNVTSSAPDSLAMAVKRVDAVLLHDMTREEWDFSSYPLPGNIDAYENRIFHVQPIFTARTDSLEPPDAFLAASFRPLTIGIDELDADWRNLGFQAMVLILIYTAVTALIIMAWASRRIRGLSRGVAAFADGDFAQRVPDGSGDEIGALGRHFNTMAGRIEQMMAELGAKEEFQRHLVANVSHDLRTPLASLRGYVETLSLDPGTLSRAERQRYLEIITGNLDHLDKLIERTLILSRLDSGQTETRREDFPLGELADAVVSRCLPIARQQGVEIELEEGEDPQGCMVRADALQIGQALQNLLENGIKFNRTGGRVRIRIIPREEDVEIVISDDGPGIDATDLPHIFDRFYTGSKSRTRRSLEDSGYLAEPSTSNGLGLAIAQKIVSGHGGRLEVASSPGQGTEFRFALGRATEQPGIAEAGG